MASKQDDGEDPQGAFLLWRKLWGSTIVKAWRTAGDIPNMLLIFIPRLTLSYIVVAVGQMGRAIARLFGTPSSYEPKANLRILIITDYMPPQTHGIAIRFRIPVYCSHHVDMEYYIDKYMRFRPFAMLGTFLYWSLVKLPSVRLANVNAAPTLTFLDAHLPATGKPNESLRRRIPSGVVAARFCVDDPAQLRDERREMLRVAGADPSADACVWLMVQRLAPEKSTMQLLEALCEMRKQGQTELDGRPIKLVIAGDGPARKGLEQYAASNALPVSFVGNLSQTALPPLYRAADVFITCSTSETYGLTVLEALACGTPVVLPHCGVFDELWAGRIPDEWRYPPAEQRALISSLKAASAKACKERLQREPIKASWADAADGLLGQYQEAIQANLPYRQELASYTRAFNQFARAALLCLFMWWLLKEYTIELSLLVGPLIGIEREEPRVRKPFWQPLKPFLRTAAGVLRALGED